MPALTLVVMAAGIGSRYGGLKQLEPVGPGGEIIIDYSVYDALRAGFDKIIFIVREDIKDLFREKIGKNVENAAETDYVIQSLDQLPPGFSVPPGRLKPWGTAQAILSCREAVRTPFVAINADDFYGPTAFEVMARFLIEPSQAGSVDEYAMVGYRLINTLSDHGHVARGICTASPDGHLIDIRELMKVQRFGIEVRHTENGVDWIPLSPEAPTSMNFWGFTPGLFEKLEFLFPEFLRDSGGTDLKAEFLIPEAVGQLVREAKARVKILPTQERWFGVTYPDDLPFVREAILELVRKQAYPPDLWTSR